MDSEDVFLRMWDREFQTTIRVFKAFPGDHLESKPQAVLSEGRISVVA
jgi:hypothetical protein